MSEFVIHLIMKPETMGPWVEEFLSAQSVVMEYEALWAVLRQAGDKELADRMFARYVAEVRRGMPSMEPQVIRPERLEFERYNMAFDRLLAWRLRDREFYLGTESTDHDICIRAGVLPRN